MKISRLRTPGAALTLFGLVLGVLVLGGMDPAAADSVTTKTGQKLSVEVSGRLAAGRALAQGTARISSGPTTIASVRVSFDNREDITVGIDARGRFEVDVPSPDATSVTVLATVTATDGTVATATAEGQVPTTAPRVHHRHLADTGSGNAGTLGPLGAALLLAGTALVRWSRGKKPGDAV